jgi:hypothetical protein
MLLREFCFAMLIWSFLNLNNNHSLTDWLIDWLNVVTSTSFHVQSFHVQSLNFLCILQDIEKDTYQVGIYIYIELQLYVFYSDSTGIVETSSVV